MRAKVSILTPCYNVKPYIDRYLTSVLEQDYRPIELILVNDGSTDGTGERIRSRIPELISAGIDARCLEKSNGGLASAIAYGLPFVSGEYLTWPDSDDFLLPGSISHRVDYLEKHPDCGVVRSNGFVFREGNYDKPMGKVSNIKKTTTMSDFVRFQVTWMPGCYMVRTAALDETNPRRYVYDSPAGQDIQMMLPIVYKYPCEYLDEYLFGYLLRPNSHSHSINTYEKQIKRTYEYLDCVRETLKAIPGDTDKYLRQHEEFVRMCLLEVAWKYKNKQGLAAYGKELRERGEHKAETAFMSAFPYGTVSSFVLRVVRAIKRRIQ